MTNLQTTISSRIARRAEQGARPVIPTQISVEKLITDSNSIKNNSLMKAKRDIRIATFNVRTIKKESTISELIASAIATNHDIICLQEHRSIHEGVDTNCIIQ